MAGEQGKPPGSIDERLEALTMNLELQFRETEALREKEQQANERIDALGRYIESLAANTAREFADVRESIRSLAESTANLVIAAQAANARIERLERKTA